MEKKDDFIEGFLKAGGIFLIAFIGIIIAMTAIAKAISLHFKIDIGIAWHYTYVIIAVGAIITTLFFLLRKSKRNN